jgi:[acyl-carrier-protein] S-malonyltransferase
VTAFLFPGQGSQAPGMGLDFFEGSEVARAVFDAAATRNSEGFLETIFEGSKDDLSRTDIAQVALLTVEIAVLRHLEALGHHSTLCVGHSLGEIPALVAAQALTFDDAMTLTQARGQCMHEFAPEGSMAAVIGMAEQDIAKALPGDVEVANYNGPAQTIISGTKAGIELATQSLKDAGAKRVMQLPVSGPFHSRHMRAAAEAYTKTLNRIPLEAPKVPFVSSVSAQHEDDPERIRALLAKQICAPVRWTGVMRILGAVRALEVGPGRVLQGMAKRMERAPVIEMAGTLEAADALEVIAA